jgi:hypothetical protein
VDDKILIIANGPSILKQKFGIEINKFDEVARINNYKINHFDEYIGSKTTIWFNGGNQNLKKNISIPKKVFVFIPYDILNRKEEKIKKQLPNRLGINPADYTIVKKENMKQYESKSNIKRPTTGFNSILWAIENYKNVIIHGFDFFQDGKEHYYDSNFMKKISNLKVMKKAGKHNNIDEKKFVQSLIEQNKVIKLSDFLKR